MKTISQQEGQLIRYFNQRNQPCFSNSQAGEAYPQLSKNGIAKLLSHMTSKGLLMRVRSSLYYVIPYEKDADTFMPDWHLLAPYLVRDRDYYIAYASALQVHGLNTQPSLQEQIVVNKQIRPSTLSVRGIPFQFIYHRDTHFFGYHETWVDSFHRVHCTDIEKTIIDSLFKPNYAGGIVEIAKAVCLAKNKLNMQKLLAYSQLFRSQAVIKRLGFLLELLHVKTPILKKLQAIKSNSIAVLDPEIPSVGKIVTRWSIQQNIDSDTIQSSILT